MAEFTDQRLRRAHADAARSLARADFLHRRLRDELADRLEFVGLQPAVIVDLGAGPEGATALLRRRFPAASILAVDHVQEALWNRQDRHVLCAEAQRLPLPDQSVDLVFCNLMLAYCRDPVPVLAEVARVLRRPGAFLFTTLGPDSFREWRDAWRGLDDHSHTVAFPDMHDLGDLAIRAGLAEPVLDREELTVTYDSAHAFATDLRAVGSVNWMAKRRRGLVGRETLASLLAALDRQRDGDGRWPVTLEVICGQAWAGEQRALGPNREAEVPVAAIRRRRQPPGAAPS